jgi:hypothetical protein
MKINEIFDVKWIPIDYIPPDGQCMFVSYCFNKKHFISYKIYKSKNKRGDKNAYPFGCKGEIEGWLPAPKSYWKKYVMKNGSFDEKEIFL